MRSPELPYGLPKSELAPREQEELRLGTFFALKSAAFAKEAHRLGIPFVIENPEPRPDAASIFQLEEFKELASSRGVSAVNFDQCRWGAETAKPTRLLVYGVELDHLALRCNHPKWRLTWTTGKGTEVTGFRAHPPLAGRVRPDGSWATKSAAAYPTLLNKELVRAFSGGKYH